MSVPIELPPAPQRPRGLLLDAAERIPADAYKVDRSATRWVQDGVTWNPHMYRRPQVAEAQCETVYSKDPSTLDDLVTQQPFLLWDSLSCGAVSGMRDWMEAELAYSIDVLRSAAFAAEMETAAASGGIGLIGSGTYPVSVVTGSASPLSYAMSELEEYLASALNGAIGMIHMSPGALGLAASRGFVYWDGSAYRTHTGHIVTGDAGYTGVTAPVGGWGDALTDELWVRASSMVWYDETAVQDGTSFGSGDTGDFNPNNNVVKPLVERYGIIVFEPSVLAAAHVDLTVDSVPFGS